MNACGFTYVATGRRFKEEANVSCASLKKHMPDSHVTVFVDDEDGLQEGIYDQVIKIDTPNYSFYDKIHAFLNTPYQKTVYIDTDTFVCDQVADLFEILDRFDVAAVRDHWSLEKQDCPRCFDDFNTGLVAFCNKPTVIEAIRSWEAIYRYQIENKVDVDHDQPAFRSAIYKHHDVTVYVLPKNYNLRLTSPIFLGYGFFPKILHGRSPDFPSIVRKLSKSDDFRFFLPNGSLVDRTDIGVIDKISGLPYNVFSAVGKAVTRILRKIKS